MKSEISAVREPHPNPATRRFSQRLSSTARGARLARLLTVQQLADWGWARDSEPVHAAALLVAELAANAVTHGRVRGRDFLVTLSLAEPADGAPTVLRVEVADCRGERAPTPAPEPGALHEHGRGLLVVESLAARWGTEPRHPSGKTVWAEVHLGAGSPA